MDRAPRFELAGEHDEALRLYRDSHLHLDAGTQPRRLGEDRAIEEYHRGDERVIELRKDYVEAGDILLKKTGRADLAGAYFALGWRERRASLANAKSALPCAERLIEIYAFAEPREPFWELLTETEVWLREPGWAHDADGSSTRWLAWPVPRGYRPAEIRDRCRVGLAGLRGVPMPSDRGRVHSASQTAGRRGRVGTGALRAEEPAEDSAVSTIDASAVPPLDRHGHGRGPGPRYR